MTTLFAKYKFPHKHKNMTNESEDKFLPEKRIPIRKANSYRRRIHSMGLHLLLTAGCLAPAAAADFTVINTNASGAGSFSVILAFANVSTDPTVNIHFLSAVFDASQQSIAAPATPYIVSRPIIFHGPPSGVVLQQTNGSTQRVLEITNTAVGQTTFTDIDFSKGGGGAGGQLKIEATGSGGTVNVAFNHCDFTGATSTGRGGSCVVTGGAVVSFNRCYFGSNVSYTNGGSLAIIGSTATFRTCHISGSTALDSGGGIFASNATVSLFSCTLRDNIAGSHSYAQPASADEIGNGGGICSSGTSTVTLVNTLLFENRDVADEPLIYGDEHPDLSGTFVSTGHNFLSKRDGALGFGPAYFGTPPPADQIGTIAAPLDPLLGFDGAPVWLSPVRGAGINSAASGFLLDLLGNPRISGSKIDIGAYEMQFYYTVTNDFDSGPGSLRDALMTGASGERAIDFDPGFFSTPRTITLLSQLPQIVGNKIIDASMANGVTVNGNDLYPIFHFGEGSAGDYIALHSLHLKNGLGNVGPISASAFDLPSSEYNSAMFDCTVSSCTGGPIRTFSGTTMINCTIAGNSAPTSLVCGVYGSATLIHCTIVGNSSRSGGPLVGSIYLGNCIVSGNTTSNGSVSLTGIISSGGNITDLAFTLPQSTDLVADARLSPTLTLNGGLVPTRDLLLNSPAIDNGELLLFFGYTPPAKDANGRARILGSLPDAGASEWKNINYAGWKPLVFTTTPVSQQGPLRDPDDDGVPNAVEFFCGTDPLVFSANPLVLKYESGVVTLQYPKAPGRLIQTAQLMSSSKLTGWASLQAFPEPTLLSSAGFADIYQTIGSPGFNKRFFRFEVNP